MLHPLIGTARWPGRSSGGLRALFVVRIVGAVGRRLSDVMDRLTCYALDT